MRTYSHKFLLMRSRNVSMTIFWLLTALKVATNGRIPADFGVEIPELTGSGFWIFDDNSLLPIIAI